jgi:tetratricopeptide (TPR) repeat protein
MALFGHASGEAPMFSRPVLAFLFLLTLVVLSRVSIAQDHMGNVQVRVSYANGVTCNQQLRVDLISASASTVSAYTNSECMAAFNNVLVGDYHAVVSGDGIQTSDGAAFPVDERKIGQYQFISVQRTTKNVAVPGVNASENAATVSAAALQIPREAQKNFDKASDLIAKQDWAKAREKLEKALAIDPQYAEACNNLGVVMGRLGDRVGELGNLEKAIALNPHFAEAYVNLAKFSIKLRDMLAAESYLVKAVAAGGTDSATMTLLANVQLLNKRYEQAVSTCLGLHNGSPSPHTFCHYISAHALESENRMDGARQELQLFLVEESKGPRADQVRKELAGLQAR